MKLRFLCSNHRNWLISDSEATHASWLRSSGQAELLLNAREGIKAVNYAGCALEAAELLVFTHARQSAPDILRFADSAVLLCQALIRIGQPRLACGVIGGSIARLEELLLQGIERTTVLNGCQRLLRVGDESPVPGQLMQDRQMAAAANWSVH
jgi:hypothetical protein